MNLLRCRAMFQIIGSAGRGALRHVLLVSCSCGVMAGVVFLRGVAVVQFINGL